ncbi:ACT domain-containing protein ACR11 [Citrus sinensis]|uniref:ACT domain-containing protein ACR11 n=1 Tax=Citrus sinensis TaxID=2711 RepID=A0ACB8JEJ5_CITSI|nr:ACT domain-containing protein ACR11 [Citrus sinensis]
MIHYVNKNCVYKSLLFLSILMADITRTLKPISTFFFLFSFHSAHFLRHSLLSDLGSFHFAYSLYNGDTDTIPTPKVIIDLDSDPDATIVEITFGDRLGALLDTMNALKNLGLNVVKANVFLDSSGKHNKFAITKADTGRKVDDPEVLEAIRLTVINNLLQYHPESSSQLAMGVAFGVDPPKQQVDVDIATHISVFDDGPDRSLLLVETADRPGLLVDLVKIITDINVNVESGEFDTEGLLAKAKFHVSYKGKAIIKPLQQVLANSLRYFLRRPTTEEASF